ncbi:phosphate ABC transporter substrate-binding protein PstS [Mycobacterium heidelbergense]|uniref:Phosphate-binding protein n=1 Tax=Mycobacterium heidelbergense TaxID=53376 RepID=A0A1X0DV53_MYCHE|nr:phosphate ABC transporter substrate-binding protein PstS [Mycobacterium heidelbergense]MCV7052911.1 phosphate ABC transporter substrate-binding protein PstS [Mycobacterium heidelbergense]ORA76283.1 phosphate ABC transporter substrate-binding protein PstS [Mycobacterium heidelbergense]BBZ50929.1 phosphate-binding protein PstS [Mycobacterium heidelbergense]
MRLDGKGRALTAVALAAAVCGGTACGSDDNRRGAVATSIPGSAGTAGCGGKNRLTAEGSTAQQNAIALFNQVWGQYCPGKGVAYNPTGSGAGREQFVAGHVDFAGADSPLVADQIGPAAKRCDGNPAWDLPLVFGPVALVYNLPGVPRLVVSSDALAKVFSGRITAWNDPVLAALNPGVALPDTKVVPIYRADSSGTTDNVQKYLTAAAPQSWTRGVGTEFQGGVGEGATKSAGVVQAVRTTPGAIGYVEKGFADQAGVPYALIDTGNGVVQLTNDTAGNAIQAARFVADGNDLVLDLNSMYASQRPGTYPLVLATYEIVCSKGYDPDTSTAIKSFLTVAANNGQAGLASAGYVPLPDKVKERLVTAINALQ